MERKATVDRKRVKEVRWQDPLALATAARELAGLAFLEAIIAGELPPPPIAALIGMRLIAVSEGEATFACEADESVYNTIGSVHGGFLCTLLDTAAGCAVQTTLPAGSGYSSIEIKVSFLRPVTAGREIEIRGRVLRTGRRVAFAEGEARDTTTGELVAHATTSVAILRPKAAEA